MAIDMDVLIGSVFTVSQLIEGVSETLSELTGCESPDITVEEWIFKDERRMMQGDSKILTDGFMLVNIKNRDATVLMGVMPDLEYVEKLLCKVSMECYRSPLEYVLGAACAIWIARSQGTQIQDNWTFWTDADEIKPDDLARIIRVRGSRDLEAACKAMLRSRLAD